MSYNIHIQYESDTSIELLCNPPLGQTTVVTGSEVNVVVAVFAQHRREWDAALWCESEEGVWSHVDLYPRQSSITDFSPSPGKPWISSFSATVHFNERQRPLHFTVKYRCHGDTWQWANELCSTGNAEVVLQREDPVTSSICHYLHGTASTLDIAASTAPLENRVWYLTATVPAANGECSAIERINLGLPTKFSRWFAMVRETRQFMKPDQGSGKFSIQQDAILLSFLLHDGMHLVMLALSLNDVMSVFQSDSHGNVVLVARNDGTCQNPSIVVVAVGKSFESANEAAILEARRLVLERSKLSQAPAETNIPSAQALGEWYDNFAYCTWNGIGRSLTERTLFTALRTMSEAGIRFSNLIIDDGWQSVDDHGNDFRDNRWVEFEASKKVFPLGLKRTVSKLREEFPWIKHIGIWHGILGYWNGIAPDGPLAKEYKTACVKLEDNGFFPAKSTLAVVDEDVPRLYDDFYRFLASCGINSVKTDTQMMLEQLSSASRRHTLMSSYNNAFHTASTTHFGTKAISCMSQTPPLLFSPLYFLPTKLPSLLFRNSEDFFPDVASSHTQHIFANAHNSVLTRYLNIIPDWDMFQTSHEYSAFHAAARAVSGGPIYFTDAPGQHDLGLIEEMTAIKLKRGHDPCAPGKHGGVKGERIILRPEVAKTRNVYAGLGERAFLKVGTKTREVAIPMLGIFNVTDSPLSEMLTLGDFEGAEKGEEYIVRSYVSEKISHQVGLDDKHSLIAIGLGVKGYDILTLFRLSYNSTLKLSYAVLGLVDKMAGAAALASFDSDSIAGRLRINVRLKALGVLGIYLSDVSLYRPHETVVRMYTRTVPPSCVSVDGRVLKIDLEKMVDLNEDEKVWLVDGDQSLSVSVRFGLEKDAANAVEHSVQLVQ